MKKRLCGTVSWAALAAAGMCLAAAGAQATDGTWLAAPATSDWNTCTNWSSSPTVPNGTATFAQSTQTSVTFSQAATSVGAIQFTAGAPAYSFNLTSVALTVQGAGISPSAQQPTFTTSIGGSLTFTNGAIASNVASPFSPIFVFIENFSSFPFGTGTSFRDISSAGNARITNSNVGTTFFHDQSSAGNAAIFNVATSATFFTDQSTAGSASISNTNGNSFTNFVDMSTAGNAHITNSAQGGTIFRNQATASSATIFNDGGGDVAILEFHDTSTAEHATITNDGNGAQTSFYDSSTADSATITSANGGSTFFKEHSTAGFARLVILNFGAVDISGLTSAGMTAGSIEGAGTYFLGSKTLTVGLNNLSTEVSGVIADGGASGGAGASLVKVGSGTLTLSGTNTYTGATAVNEGALIVNGSIASSLLTVVNAGATLGGTGIAGNTLINGGTLSPGNSIGTLTIQGNLVLTAAAAYIVEVSPTSADRTNVTGTASLGGTVQAAFGPGSNFAKTYTILSATGGLAGTFGSLTTTGLPTGFTASLSYTATDAILNLTATLGGAAAGGTGAGSGLSSNQAAVAAAINNFFNNGGTLPAGFVNLFNLTGANLANALALASGEAATGAQLGAFQLMSRFLGIMLDPFVDGRGGGAGGSAIGFAPERPALPEYIALAYANALKAPAKAPLFEQRWTAWGGGYGGYNKTSGDAVGAGSHDLSARAAGFAAGLDYRSAPGTLVGFALAGGGTGWSLAQGLGSGRSDAFQAGVYGATRSGPAYLAASLAYTSHWMSTDRVAVAGDHLTADFRAQSYGARVETGYRIGSPLAGVAPYAAAQWQGLRTPSYRETDGTGPGFALSYNARTGTDTRSELGARFDRAVAITPAAVLTLRSRLAWAHDWVSDPSLIAAFQTLPGASFIVNGATPAKNSALVSAGSELRLVNGVALAGKLDGELGRGSATYAGTGTLRVNW